MKGQLRIDKMFAFIVIDDDGTEGVIAIHGFSGNVFMPLIGADTSRIESLIPKADEACRLTGKKYRIIEFSTRKDVTIDYKS